MDEYLSDKDKEYLLTLFGESGAIGRLIKEINHLRENRDELLDLRAACANYAYDAGFKGGSLIEFFRNTGIPS
jgi:hypothetical protein